MDWFKGSIIEAITASRQRKCLFVVVIAGDDESSKQLLERLNDDEVSQIFKNFVSISLKMGSVEANQFSQLCKTSRKACHKLLIVILSAL